MSNQFKVIRNLLYNCEPISESYFQPWLGLSSQLLQTNAIDRCLASIALKNVNIGLVFIFFG